MTSNRPLLPAALHADKPGLHSPGRRKPPSPDGQAGKTSSGSAVARTAAGRKSAASEPGTDSAAPAADFAQALAQRLWPTPDAEPGVRQGGAAAPATETPAPLAPPPQAAELPAPALPVYVPTVQGARTVVAGAMASAAPGSDARPAEPIHLPSLETPAPRPAHRDLAAGAKPNPPLAAGQEGATEAQEAERASALDTRAVDPATSLQASPPAARAEVSAPAADASAPLTPTFTPQAAVQVHVAEATTAPAPATFHLPQPLGSTAWHQALGQQVLFLRQAGMDSAQLQLHPQDLGVLQVHLQLDGGRLSAQFHAAHAEVREAVQAALPQLQTALAEQGLSLGQTQVGSGQGQAPGQGDAPPPSAHASPLSAGAHRQAKAGPILSTAPGRLHVCA